LIRQKNKGKEVSNIWIEAPRRQQATEDKEDP